MDKERKKTMVSIFFRWAVIGLSIFLPLFLFQNCSAIHLTGVSTPQNSTQNPSPDPTPVVEQSSLEPGNDPAKFAIPQGYTEDPSGVFIMGWHDSNNIFESAHQCSQWNNCMSKCNQLNDCSYDINSMDDGRIMFFSGGHFNVGGYPNTAYSVKIEIPQLGTILSHEVGYYDEESDSWKTKVEKFPFQGFAIRIGQDSIGAIIKYPFLAKGTTAINISQIPFDMGSTQNTQLGRPPDTTGSNIPRSCIFTMGVITIGTDEAHVGSHGCVVTPGKTYYMNFFMPNLESSDQPRVVIGTLWDAYTQWLPIDPIP